MKIAQSNVNLVSTSKHYESNLAEFSSGIAVYGKFQGNLEAQQKKTLDTMNSISLKNTELSGEGTALGSENYNSLKPTKSAQLSPTEQSLAEQLMAIRTSLLDQILKFMQRLGSDSKSASYNDMLGKMSGLIQSGSMLSVTTLTQSHIEEEEVLFEGTGTAFTEDGRIIDFGVSFSMSSKLVESAGLSFAQSLNFLDPLVINVGSDVTTISDQSFYFDLDCDGTEEKIANLADGSGFLALDINNDGKINDGSELFGTQSGNGFNDLSAYDKDGNGWIDENDEIYNKLRVWIKNEDGTDTLLSLKQADVGAIYLKSAMTDYQLRDGSFNIAAKLRSSGVYLKESGGAGVVQQIDLAAR